MMWVMRLIIWPEMAGQSEHHSGGPASRVSGVRWMAAAHACPGYWLGEY